MTRRVFRYVVPVDDHPYWFPLTGEPLSVALAEPGPGRWAAEFWAEHDEDAGATDRAFQVFGTGHPLPAGARFVGTLPRTHGMVFHLFEVTP